MADTDTPKAEPKDAPKKRSSGHAKTYERVVAFVQARPAGNVAGETDARLHTYISDADWIAVVNHEQVEAGKEPLSDAEALAMRPKLFSRKRIAE